MTAKKSLMTAALGLSAALAAGSAFAGGQAYVLCHNIGGPMDLGANCEATGNCSVALEGGEVLTFSANQFLGIIIGASENAWAAHLAHGDGFATRVFDPPLHLASVIGPHQASNVECLARRATTEQPPEPGN
ncbi:hypothetical protein [Agrilutibacter solisilvae]|uniref:Secreted protein n=1 Tax=Agrilutibacter solisilvae TaxID=2763317 RepID=A0A974XZQ8_9GAMM|nr:hypothetical protein [Lysobacter solisilvae]QSX77930.1 hypothetical protein I8J32_014565 [Lysobacter solisilvae]